MTDDKQETWEEVTVDEEPQGKGPTEADPSGEPQEAPTPHDAAPDDKERGPHD